MPFPCMQEFDMLGSQTLADLKDAFICDEDLTSYCESPYGQFCGCQSTTSFCFAFVLFSARRYPWSCFFINGTFYSDDRDPNVPDHSS